MSKEKFVRDKPHVNIGLLITLFSIVSAVALGITIYKDVLTTLDSDGDSISDDIEARDEIPLFLDFSDEVLTISTFNSGTSTTSGGHEVGHHLGLSHGFGSHLELLSALYNDISSGIPTLEFGIKYDSLIEFIDADGNGYFSPVLDIIIGQTALTNLSLTEVKFGIDGQPAYYVGYSTNNAVFQVDYYRSKEHVLLSRGVGLLAPNELKSIITFNDYVPLTSGVQIALNLSLTSNQNIIFSNSSLVARTSAGDFNMNYEWFDWNLGDKSNSKLNITIPSTSIPSKKEALYINFGEVVNDSFAPKLSWILPSLQEFSFLDLPWGYISMGTIALLAVVSTLRVVRKKLGRLKYSSPSKSKDAEETLKKAEKRIPETIKHRDR